MKTIELRVVKIESNEDVARTGFELRYRTEFLRLVSTFSQGLTIDEQRRMVKLNKKLRHADEVSTILLEDAEWEILKQNVLSAKFTFFAEELIEMADSVINAEDES